ncbi:DEAD/DEAH box helicase [Patescibacteria group bacterium]|nr:DEAD/DEAH box helicase [Patescibacteria group bacterium]
MTTFKELGLNTEILKSLDNLGFVEPSPVQAKAIPFILQSTKHLIALAQTGTGKTAAYGLPILNQIKSNERELQTIVLCPTRELCIQIFQDIKKYSKYSKGISVTPVYGGERIDSQIRSLRNGTNIVVGTPGRVHDLIRRKVLKLQSIKWLVIDEADEMLDMGFKDDLDAILEQTPDTKQTLLFSATMSKSVHSIAKKYMGDAEEMSLGEKNKGADNVSHEYYVVQPADRFEVLRRLLDHLPGVYGILFCRTRIETQEVADKLKLANYNAEALHGEISQQIRTKIMDRFKRKLVHLLIATDVAARGIDVNNLTHVINYSLPDQSEAYTHRSGRTGRAQNIGVSISIINPREVGKIKRLETMIGKKIELKQVPNGGEVCKKQIESYIAEVEVADIKDFGTEPYFVEFTERLKSIKKEDLIKRFVAHRFSSLLAENKNNRNLNAVGKAVVERKVIVDEINFKINIGKKHGFDIQAFFRLINTNRNLKGIEIGRINLMQENSLFSTERKSEATVLRFLNGVMFKGQKIFITKADSKVSFKRSGRVGFSKRTDRKKMPFRKAKARF